VLFQPVDPFNPEVNPLGPRRLSAVYLDGASAIAAGMTYAALVAQQQYLDTSELDAGLAVELDAYQRMLNQQARYFSRTVTADFIRMCSDASNFAALVGAFAGPNRPMIAGAWEKPARRKAVADMLDALADHAGEISIDLLTFDDHLDFLARGMAGNGAKFDAALAKAVAELGAKAAGAQADIDRLTKAAADNVATIVKGANEAGEAVADLVVGILTAFEKTTGKPKDDGGKKDDKAKEEGKDKDKDKAKVKDGEDAKTPAAKDEPAEGGDFSADFVLKAIKASSAGVAEYSTAIRELELNNDLLRKAYLELAALSPLIAVAKAAQAQNRLFKSAVDDTARAAAALKAEWSGVRAGLTRTSGDVEHIESEAEAATLARLGDGAEKLWSRVETGLVAIKHTLTGSGGLPGS
jgi:hypothetical protein